MKEYWFLVVGCCMVVIGAWMTITVRFAHATPVLSVAILMLTWFMYLTLNREE